MASFILVLPLLLLAALFAQPIALAAKIPNPTSRITVVGVVYCDTCLTNTFSAHSYFLPGVDVHIDCTFKASSPKTNERMLISVNRTTNKHGIYKLEVPQIDGVDCVDDLAITTVCQAGLISSSSPACSTLGLKTSTNEVSVKSRQENLCVYSLNALNYRPFKRNATLCGNKKEELQSSFNSSTFPLSYFPPYRFPWPPMPQLPPFPPLPFPPLPPLPPLLPLPSPPPFPPVPNFPPAPPLFHPPPPPAFNIGDPRTWIPNFPPLVPSPPPPPSFNLGDPRTWIPNFPPLLPSPPPRPPSPPTPPPTFNLGDPRTWVPYNPPSPPSIPQNQNP